MLRGIERLGAPKRRRLPWHLVFAFAPLMVIQLLPAAPAGALPGGTISGVVTRVIGGTPVAGISVKAYGGAYGAMYGSATTAPDGTFSMAVPAGNFKVLYFDPSGTHATVYWGGSPDWSTAAYLAVTSGGTSSGSWALKPAGKLAGTVTEVGSGTQLPGVTVMALDPVMGVVNTQTATGPDGSYALPVYAGTYRMRFTDPSAAHADLYSGGSLTFASSSTITTTTTGTTTANAALFKNPHIKGAVKASNGTLLNGIVVEVLNLSKVPVATTSTGPAGTYDVTGFGPGTYVVRFRDPGGAYSTRYSGNANNFDAATRIATTLGGVRTVNIGLPLAGRISGRARIGSFGRASEGSRWRCSTARTRPSWPWPRPQPTGPGLSARYHRVPTRSGTWIPPP